MRFYVENIIFGLLTVISFAAFLTSNAQADPPEQFGEERRAAFEEAVKLAITEESHSFHPSILDWITKKLGVEGCGPKIVDRRHFTIITEADEYYVVCDLEAQESVATSTRWLLILGIVQTIIGIAGTYLVWQTLSFNRKATEAANNAAREAQIGNKISEKNAFLERRPWLNFSDPEIASIEAKSPDNPDEPWKISVDLSIKATNIGLTPAIMGIWQLRIVSMEGGGFATLDKFHNDLSQSVIGGYTFLPNVARARSLKGTIELDHSGGLPFETMIAIQVGISYFCFDDTQHRYASADFLLREELGSGSNKEIIEGFRVAVANRPEIRPSVTYHRVDRLLT